LDKKEIKIKLEKSCSIYDEVSQNNSTIVEWDSWKCRWLENGLTFNFDGKNSHCEEIYSIKI
jgi:hypothetical protein